MSIESHRYNLGIVGCGRATANLHLPALARIPNVRVTAIADVDKGALKNVADRFGIQQRFADVGSMLLKTDIDIVAVCVPAEHHVEMALPVLQAGKHLFVEKPLALDLAGCDRLIQAASQSSQQIMVGFNLRFHRLIRQARTFIASGRLGPIEAVSSIWTSAIRHRQDMPDWRNLRARGGGALYEIAVHHFDLWHHLLGTEVAEVRAFEKSIETQDETVTISARMESGAVVNALFSECTSDYNEIQISGRNGRLKVSLTQFDGLEFTSVDSEPGLKSRLLKLPRSLASVPTGLALARRGGDYLLSYQHEWKHFLTSIEHGQATSPQATLEDGRTAVKVVLASIESAYIGQTVTL